MYSYRLERWLQCEFVSTYTSGEELFASYAANRGKYFIHCIAFGVNLSKQHIADFKYTRYTLIWGILKT